jgi:hypothetical protein
MKRVVLAAIAVLASGSSQAGYFDGGNDYWAMCHRKENAAAVLVCTATAGAYWDMMKALGYQCSTEKGVDRAQLRDALLKFLADHPEARNYAAASLAEVAFINAFGCTKPEKR